ncbi:hypothetical protein OPIT5_06165 [Opitutaceae bacterium TAV5]|nr:hypothetical protein OPIT5_06165 [Opitutaceae bacterium TAV5]
MRPVLCLLVPLVVAGCATRRPVAVVEPPPVQIAAALPTKAVETPYDVRGYREAAHSALRHEAHAVWRRSRVPLNFEGELVTVSRTGFAPASYAPLPENDELAAELATQKAITANLRTVQAAVVETERQVQAQYAALVRQSAEALRLREQLEAERAQLRAAAPPPAAPVELPASNPNEVRW